MPFVLTPPGSTDLESLEFDGLALNDTVFGLAEFSCPPPRERQNWIGAADSEFQVLSDQPKHDNRDITVKIQVAPQVNMDLALDKVAQLVDKCVKASKYQDGVELAWNPSSSARFVTFDILSAEVTDLPVDWENGWLVFAPTITIAMKAKPYWRGEETLTSATSASAPFVTAELVNNSGDVPALGRLIITDTASQARRHVEWGLEGPLTYNAATSLLIDSDSLVTSGYSGTGTTRSGAYDPGAAGNSVVTVNLTTTPTAVCGTGNQAHVGTFRVKVRVQAYSYTQFRISYQVGGGQWITGPWVTPHVSSGWLEMDLGTVTIPQVLAGTQNWVGRIDGRTTLGVDAPVIDYVELIPTSAGYGKARAVFAYQAGVTVAHDEFTSTTAGNNLNGRAAPAGGSWATSGAATDFQFADSGSDEYVTRGAAGERFAILGSTNYTNMEVSARAITWRGVSDAHNFSIIARWTDASNYVYGLVSGSGNGLTLVQVVAGSPTTLAFTSGLVVPANMWITLRLIVYASGAVFLSYLDANGSTIAQIQGADSALATGGALQTGKPGFSHFVSVGGAMPVDDFAVATPAAEPVMVYSGRNMQVRYDDTIRQDSTGVYTGRPQSYRGSRFLVPVGTSRVLVKARRNNVETAADDNVTDATQIQVGVTPRGLAVPRS